MTQPAAPEPDEGTDPTEDRGQRHPAEVLERYDLHPDGIVWDDEDETDEGQVG
jgi:hypothetical protein